MHKNIKPEGIKYQCDKCEYSATQVGNLKRHKDSMHGGSFIQHSQYIIYIP